jgi:hypothetical protein
MPKMSAIDLKALLSAERYDALSAMAASKLSDERASALNYYMGDRAGFAHRVELKAVIAHGVARSEKDASEIDGGIGPRKQPMSTERPAMSGKRTLSLVHRVDCDPS